MNKKNVPVINVDMDCILVSMLPVWIQKYNERTGETVSLDQIVNYDMYEVCRQTHVLDEILHEPGFFLDMDPMPGAVDAFKELFDHGYDIVILTQPPRKAEFAIRDKRDWVKKHLPFFPLSDMIFAHRKELVMGNLLFDDKPDHLINWKKNNPDGLLATLDWKYNNTEEINKVLNFRGSQEEGWKKFVDFVKTSLPLK